MGIVGSDQLEDLTGTSEFQQSLEEIRGSQQDTEAFFADAFSRLGATLFEAERQQQLWEQQKAEKEAALAEQAAELRRQQQELQLQREQLIADALSAAQESGRQDLRDALGSSANQADRLTAVAETLAVVGNDELRRQGQLLEQILARLAEWETPR